MITQCLKWAGVGAVLVNASAFFGWVVINWLMGCGETTYTATGAYPGECVGFSELWGPVLFSVL